ncbi:MarR family transcriptional regulator [Actinoplanes sp. TBRC 11911]|uniref:MarR family winged helix-turn-helix transcriptional regulator n=1 Tax=Actinoplanes sp. TBRC 11911 TaxID=2729386 RepID=UPI00145F40CF|nr:MarR family transcriptional regulator [Actinoplanes sp. TBRC 11911]NMO52327.1 MarR family transcriptional regulator [Actinoplanes sp. TBRC 11911]
MTDLGVLAAQLLDGFQRELFTRLAQLGHEGLRPRHGAVMAYLALTGTRASELSERSGQHKQVIGTLIDELEHLGYVTRQPDPADRRAKLIVPTERGRDEITEAGRIIADIERRFARKVGADRFAEFRAVFEEVARDYRQARATTVSRS